jgi:hypothetical protein
VPFAATSRFAANVKDIVKFYRIREGIQLGRKASYPDRYKRFGHSAAENW